LPGQLYGERIYGLDMRFSKIIRIKGTRANIGLDAYNLLNTNTPTAYEAVYNPNPDLNTWFEPTTVVQPRFVRFNVQFDF
jgi:hypothetical protein